MVRCDLCDDEDAIVHCDDCNYNFCSLCSTAVHEDAGRQDHAPYNIADGPSAAAGGADACPDMSPSSSPQAASQPGGGDRNWHALPEVGHAAASPASLISSMCATPVSPILAHRAEAPDRKPTLSECVQCASKDSFVGGICQLCGHETEAAVRAKLQSALPPRQSATVLGLLPTQRDEQAEQLEEQASTPTCPTAGHAMVMSMGQYTCNSCKRHLDSATLKNFSANRNSRWSCAACGDDYCFGCRPTLGGGSQDMPPATNTEEISVIAEYGLACRPDMPSSPTEQNGGGEDTRSTTPEFIHTKPDVSRVATRSAKPESSPPPAPVVRCGLGFRLCHSSLGKLSVDTVLPGGAAEKAGNLRSGDQILAINGNSNADLIDADEVARALVGEEGSCATLLVLRPGVGEPPFELTLERQVFAGQFDSIHSGPAPNELERPHSMPVTGNFLEREFNAIGTIPSAPLSAPMPSRNTTKGDNTNNLLAVLDAKQNALGAVSPIAMSSDNHLPIVSDNSSRVTSKSASPATSENPAMLLQERLEKAIRRSASNFDAQQSPLPPTSEQHPQSKRSPARSETPIDELLAKYISKSPPSAATRATPPAQPMSSPPAPETPPKPSPSKFVENTSKDESDMPLVCQRCQKLYLQAEIDASCHSVDGLRCCADCTNHLKEQDTDLVKLSLQTEERFPKSPESGPMSIRDTNQSSAPTSPPDSTQEGIKGSSDAGTVAAAVAAAVNAAQATSMVDVSPEGVNDSNEMSLLPELLYSVGGVDGVEGMQGNDDSLDNRCKSPAQPLTAPAKILRFSVPLSPMENSLPADSPTVIPSVTQSPAVLPPQEPEMPTMSARNALPLPQLPTSPMSPSSGENSYDSERVLRKGWLTKEANSGLKSMFMKTQKRWCVLKTGYFQYFHSQTEDGRSEVISLQSMESVSIETKKNNPFLIIKTPQRIFVFTSPDKSTTAAVFEWLQEITKALLDVPAQRPSSFNGSFNGSAQLSVPIPVSPVSSQAVKSRNDSNDSEDAARHDSEDAARQRALSSENESFEAEVATPYNNAQQLPPLTGMGAPAAVMAHESMPPSYASEAMPPHAAPAQLSHAAPSLLPHMAYIPHQHQAQQHWQPNFSNGQDEQVGEHALTANSMPHMQMQGMHAIAMPLQGSMPPHGSMLLHGSMPQHGSMPPMHSPPNGMNGMHSHGPYAGGNGHGLYASGPGMHMANGTHMPQHQMQHLVPYEQMQMHENMNMQHMQQQENMYYMYASHGSTPASAMHMSHPHVASSQPQPQMQPHLNKTHLHMPNDPAHMQQVGLRQSQNNLPIPQQEVDYHMYSSMYEHDALATRTGIMISADVSPSMAAMNDPTRPPPL